MFTSRITSLSLSNQLNADVADNMAAYSRKMLQVSSGEKYSSRSEDPTATSEVAGLNVSATQLSSWSANMKYAGSWETITDSTVQNITDTMSQLNELVTQANSTINTATQSDRDSLVAQVNSIMESLVNAGNTTYQGTSIFGGTATGDKPFTVDRDADGNITAVYFLGNDDVTVTPDTELRSMSYGNGSSYQMGLLGEGDYSLFRFSHRENLGTEDNPDWQNVKVRVFDELIKFRDALADSTKTLDSTNMERLQSALDNVTCCGVTASSNQNMVTRIQKNLATETTAVTDRTSDLTDIDDSTAITELYSIQTALQASMKMINKVNDMSILNYI